jgi:hypothetical protein
MKRVTVPGGGAVDVPDGVEATVHQRADGAQVVDVPGGGRIVFAVPKAKAPASGCRTSQPKDVTPKGVLKRVLRTLTPVERDALAQVFVDAAAPYMKRLKERVRELESENALLKSRLAASSGS